MVNTNDANAPARLEFLKQTLLNRFGFHVRDARPLAYEENFPFPYNNFVYAVTVDRSNETIASSLPNQFGAQALPQHETTFVFRLPNPVSGYNDKVRVENEVASLALARQALSPNLDHLVPHVYAWAPAREGQGWVMQQYMPGEKILEEFPSFDDADKAIVLEQMADILACFQRFRLPESIKHYGGVAFDESGKYISTALSIFDAGPFATYEELCRATVVNKLQQADRDVNVKGWQEKGIRARLDEFLAQGLPLLLREIGEMNRVLVHADFSTDNILWDKESKKITALFDFDFSHVGSVADEYFRSLGHGIGRFPCIRDEDEEGKRLHDAVLYGFPDPLPTDSDGVDWVAAEAWDDAIRSRNLQRPATISSISVLADVFWLSSQILPFRLCNEVVVGNTAPEQLQFLKQQGQKSLSKFLDDYGY